MHVRVITVTGVTRIDDGLAFIKDRVLPTMREQKGFRGLTVDADRPNGTVDLLTLWETEDDLLASESASAALRGEALAISGGEPTVETYEQMVVEIGEVPPSEGCAVRLQHTKMDPSQIDDNVAFFKAQVLPQIKAAPGFRSLRNMINRTTGHGVVGSVWDHHDAIQAEDKRYEGRERAATRGVEFTESSSRDLLFSAFF